jgi:hypothetical protein
MRTGLEYREEQGWSRGEQGWSRGNQDWSIEGSRVGV